ncbi:YncE family protein [Arthrobacter monumenti]
MQSLRKPAVLTLLALLPLASLVSCTAPENRPASTVSATEAAPSGGATEPGQSSSNAPESAPRPLVSNPAEASSSGTSTSPRKNAGDPAGKRELVLATEASSNALAVVDPGNRARPVVDEITVGTAPWDVTVHAPTRRAFVSTAEGVAVVDLEERRRTALIPYSHPAGTISFGEYRNGGTGIAVGPGGKYVYVAVVVAGGNSVLEKIDLDSEQVVDSVDVGLRPFDILISDDGSDVYTIDHDSFTVHVVDTTAMTARRIEVAPFGTEGGLGSWEKPHYAAMRKDGKILLPYQGLALAVLDPESGNIRIKDMSANSHQHGTGLSPNGSTLAVIGTGSFGNATGGPNLTLRKVATGEEEIIPLDRLHETVTFWTDPTTGREKVLLSGGYTRAGYWNGITVVDLRSYEKYTIAVPNRPQSIVTVPADRS